MVVMWPDAESAGKTQPSRLPAHRTISRSSTRSLIGMNRRPVGVLLSGTKMTRLVQSRFSIRIGNSSFFGRIPVSRSKIMMSRNSGPQKRSSLRSASSLRSKLRPISFASLKILYIFDFHDGSTRLNCQIWIEVWNAISSWPRSRHRRLARPDIPWNTDGVGHDILPSYANLVGSLSSSRIGGRPCFDGNNCRCP